MPTTANLSAACTAVSEYSKHLPKNAFLFTTGTPDHRLEAPPGWRRLVIPPLRFPLLTTMILSGYAPGPALAQTAYELPEVVVTASRVATPAEQVGSSVTVITEEQLKNRQVRIVSDVLREVPGVAVSRTGPVGNFTQARIRGAEGNQTLVLIDGIEVNDPAGGSEFNFAHLLATEIERIEVLRGPQSALWGSDAIGGVINIVTKKGSGPLRATAGAEGGSFDTRQVNAGFSGGGDRYHYALSGTYFDTDGISIASGGSEEDGYDNATLFLKGGVTPLDNLSLDFAGRYTDATTETDPQDFSFPPGPTFGQVIDGDNETDAERIYGRAQAKWVLFEGLWEHIVSAAITDTDNELFEEGTKTSRSEGQKLKYDYQTNVFLDTPVFANAHHTLTLAIEREEEEFKQRGATPDAPQNQDQEIDNTGYVAEYRVDLWDQLFLSGAGRYDDNDRFEDATTYRFTAAYLHPDTGTRVHSSYARGVKNPTFTELFGFFPDSFAGNPDLEPEESRGWDVGIEQPFRDGQFIIDVTYFRNELEDEIVPTFDPNTFLSSVRNSEGTSNWQGIELAAQATILPNLHLTGSYTYTEAEDGEDMEEVRRPKHLASLSVNYRLLNDRANLNLVVDYNGEQKDLDFTTSPASRVTLDDYVMVNLNGSYRINDNLQVFGRVENLLDEDYQEVFGFETFDRGFFVGLKASL